MLLQLPILSKQPPKSTPLQRGQQILTMEPVFAALFSYLWIEEQLTGLAVIGCLFIFLGMLLAELPGLISLAIKKAIYRQAL
ncbi:EamA family transporter [Rossellomorea vietnamensis]|uniref:EamA family transporter n=1 Tax=Rossellomorea vietnamensis TaxID=218284 RepID=UPI003CE86294